MVMKLVCMTHPDFCGKVGHNHATTDFADITAYYRTGGVRDIFEN